MIQVKFKAIFYTFFGLLLTFGVTSCGEEDLSQFNPVISLEEEKSLGKLMVDAIFDGNGSGYDVLNRSLHHESYAYFESFLFALTNTLSIRSQYDWELFILDDDTRDGIFGLPGGKVFICSGLLKKLKSEHELIALLAHELYFVNRDMKLGEEYHSVALQTLAEAYSRQEIGATINLSKSQNAYTYFQGFANMEYDPSFTDKADAFSVSIICPFSYNRLGVVDILTRYEDGELVFFGEQNSWLDLRPSMEANMQRINKITELVYNCDGTSTDDEVQKLKNEQRYQKAIEELP